MLLKLGQLVINVLALVRGLSPYAPKWGDVAQQAVLTYHQKGCQIEPL